MSPACLFFPSSANEKQSSLSVLWDPECNASNHSLTNWKAEAQYDTALDKIKKKKKKGLLAKILNLWNNDEVIQHPYIC